VGYDQVIVNKPWGHEYLVYENEQVGLWFLHIDQDQATSMHCHPKKNTGLVLLEGAATTSFLNDSVKMVGLKKLMIRRGLFHSTRASGLPGASIFEIESPRDKKDLVRLEDAYGRKGRPYEDKKYEVNRDKSCLWIEDPPRGKKKSYYFRSCEIFAESIIEKSELMSRDNSDLFIFLRGAIISDNNDFIAQPGDVISGMTLKRLLQSFDITDEVVLLSILPALGAGGNGYGCP
jgi:mannose-6-phosphate isomerase-like protein (cupin superfamily)